MPPLKHAPAAKSAYDRVFGKSPRLNFDTDRGGIELHIFNGRTETIIAGRIEAASTAFGIFGRRFVSRVSC